MSLIIKSSAELSSAFSQIVGLREVDLLRASLQRTTIDDLTILTVPQSTPAGVRHYQMIHIRLGDSWGYLSHYGAPIAYDNAYVELPLSELYPIPLPILLAAADAVAAGLPCFQVSGARSRTEQLTGPYSVKRTKRHEMILGLMQSLESKSVTPPSVFSFGYFHTLKSRYPDRFSHFDWCDTSIGVTLEEAQNRDHYDFCLVSGSAIGDLSFSTTLHKAQLLSNNVIVIAQSCCNLLKCCQLGTSTRLVLFLEKFPFWYFEGDGLAEIIFND